MKSNNAHKSRGSWRALLLGLATLAAACQHPPPSASSPVAAVKRELASEPPPAPEPVPDEVSNALVPSIKLDAHQTPQIEDEQRFDIAVNEVPAQQFFMSLVDGTKYNMVVHPEVSGKISLNLRNVTIPDVVAAARDVYGFEFERTPYGFQVLPSRLEARVFQINYLNVTRTGSSSTFVSSGTLQQVPDSMDSGEGSQGRQGGRSGNRGGGSGGGGGGDRNQRAVVGTQVNTNVPETSFWQELTSALHAIVGNGEGRSVVVNPQSGMVVVRAIPTELREVETYLQTAQLIAQRQVILEAKVLEVELSDGFQSGINWTAVLREFTLGQTGGGSIFNGDAGVSDLSGTNFNMLPGQFNPALPASAFGGVFSLAVKGGDFSGFLELLKSQGDVQVLSSPRISTMNNQKAIIKVGTDEFFVTDVSTTTITGTATTTTPNIELTPFFSGIALDVTPQISREGLVTLHIHPSVSEVSDQQKKISIAGVDQTLPLARSAVRESDSVVQARSGQLVVIGGLMQTREKRQTAKTPGVGDAPVVGGLFRQQRSQSSKSELVILLRPVVIENSSDWAKAVNQTREGLDLLDGQMNRREEPVLKLGPDAP